MNKERLLKLAEYLKIVPNEEFDLSSWRCLTTACAVGHACCIPEFKELGLCLKFESPDNLAMVPQFEDKNNWDAVEKFFDLNEEDSMYLFEIDEYKCWENNPIDVAERIEEFVNR